MSAWRSFPLFGCFPWFFKKRIEVDSLCCRSIKFIDTRAVYYSNARLTDTWIRIWKHTEESLPKLVALYFRYSWTALVLPLSKHFSRFRWGGAYMRSSYRAKKTICKGQVESLQRILVTGGIVPSRSLSLSLIKTEIKIALWEGQIFFLAQSLSSLPQMNYSVYRG